MHIHYQDLNNEKDGARTEERKKKQNKKNRNKTDEGQAVLQLIMHQDGGQ